MNKDKSKKSFEEEHQEIISSGSDFWKHLDNTLEKPVDITSEETDGAYDELKRTLFPEKRVWVHPVVKYGVAASFILVAAVLFLVSEKKIVVPNGELKTVTLNDGSTININHASSISYNRLYGFTNRDIKLSGEAYFSVNDSEMPFTVHTSDAQITVLGTKFNVKSRPEEILKGTFLDVTKGAVRFALKGKKQVRQIEAGESAFSVDSSESIEVGELNDLNLGWRKGNLYFNNQPLADIFKELEYRFNVKVDIKIGSMKYEKLTAYYTNPKLITIIDDICRIEGLTYSKTQQGYLIEN